MIKNFGFWILDFGLRILAGIAFVLIVTGQAMAALDFKAEVDNPGPAVGERITYTITLTTDGTLPDIEPPELDGFEIVAGPSVSTSINMINMSVTKSKSVTYVLRPTRAGSLTIKPAQAKIKGKFHTSNPVRVEVVQSSKPPSVTQGPKPSTSGKQPSAPNVPSEGGQLPEVFITATADKTTLYKQEMALITYKLYLRVNVLNYEIAKTPQATGFWTEEFPTSNRPVLEDVNIRGTAYKVAVIRKTGVFPTRTGKLTLDPLTLDLTIEKVASRRKSRDPFDSFFDDPFFSRSSRVVQSVTSDQLTLNVRDFPAGAPVDFKGDVGDFRLQVNYDKRELAQHDALTVKLTVSGTGYLKTVDAPKLELPSGFEAYAPTTEDNITISGNQMRGRKTFTYLVIPRRSGNFTLPKVEFSYFDPESGSYKTSSSGGLELAVSPAEGGDQGSPLFGGGSSEVTLLDSDVRFIKSLSGPLKKTTKPPYNSPLFFVLLGLAPLLFAGGIGFEKYQEKMLADPLAVRRRKAPEKMRKALEEAEKLAKTGSSLKAVETAAKGLAEMVGATIDEPTAGLTSDVVRRKLEELSAEDDLIAKTLRLLGEADRVRFGGTASAPADIAALLDEFKVTAERLQLRNRG